MSLDCKRKAGPGPKPFMHRDIMQTPNRISCCFLWGNIHTMWKESWWEQIKNISYNHIDVCNSPNHLFSNMLQKKSKETSGREEEKSVKNIVLDQHSLAKRCSWYHRGTWISTFLNPLQPANDVESESHRRIQQSKENLISSEPRVFLQT